MSNYVDDDVVMVIEAADALGQRAPGEHSLLDTNGILDESNPRSLLSIAPRGVADLIGKLPPEWLKRPESVLVRMVQVEPQLNRLRIAFWKEYDHAQSQMRGMLWANISRLVQRPSVSIADYFHNHATLAYILCPPASYDVFLEEALSHGMGRIREILDLPLTDENGRVNAKVGELILKAAAFLDLRTHGGFLQKSAHVEVGIGVNQMKKFSEQMSIADIDKKIKELENVGTIDVEPK